MSKQSKHNRLQDEGLSRSEIENLIEEYVFHERNREILKRRWLDGITFDALAEEFDMSVRHVKNIVYKSEGKVFVHIKSS